MPEQSEASAPTVPNAARLSAWQADLQRRENLLKLGTEQFARNAAARQETLKEELVNELQEQFFQSLSEREEKLSLREIAVAAREKAVAAEEQRIEDVKRELLKGLKG